MLGTNNYIVISDNGSKHVSGDCMSARAAKPTADAPLAPATATTADNIDENTVMDDDNLSIISDISEDLEMPNAPFNNNNNNNVINNNNNRRGQRELNNLLPVQSLSRLRSGRNT